MGIINAPIMHEGSVMVEVQRDNRALWGMVTVHKETGNPIGSLLACLCQEDHVLLSNAL